MRPEMRARKKTGEPHRGSLFGSGYQSPPAALGALARRLYGGFALQFAAGIAP
jgi:hypothetical protein